MAGIVPATRFESVPNLEMRFPPLPGTVMEISKLVAEDRDNPDTARLVDVVNRDPVVAATVLRRINSAYYGMRRLVGDVRKAVFLLGFVDVSNLVMTAALLQLREVLASREQVRIFGIVMRHSAMTAYLAQELARSAKLAKAPAAFTAGLLHSIGRLVLLYNKPQDYEALWCTNECGIAPSTEAERVIFGTDHARLGGLAADHWNLPKDVAALVGGYAAPHALADPELRAVGYALALAAAAAETLCAATVQIGVEEEPAGPSPALLAFAEAARLSPGEAADLLESIKANAPDFVSDLLLD